MRFDCQKYLVYSQPAAKKDSAWDKKVILSIS